MSNLLYSGLNGLGKQGNSNNSGGVSLYGDLPVKSEFGAVPALSGAIGGGAMKPDPGAPGMSAMSSMSSMSRQATGGPTPVPITIGASSRAPMQGGINLQTLLGSSTDVGPKKVDPTLTGVPAEQQGNFRSRVLFVGGLEWWVSDKTLLKHVAKFGHVDDIKIHADKVNGRSKGYGFVSLNDTDDVVEDVRKRLHGSEFDGCVLSCAYALEDRINQPEFTNTPVHIPHKRLQRVEAETNMRGKTPLGTLPQPPPSVLQSLQSGVPVMPQLAGMSAPMGGLPGGPLLSHLMKAPKQKRRSRSRSGRSRSRRSESRSYSRSRSRSRSRKRNRRKKRRR